MQNLKVLCVDLDGTLAKFEEVPIERLYEPGYFLSLTPNDQLIKVIKKAIKSGITVWAVSHYLSDSPYARKEKDAWLDWHLPEIKNRLYVPCGESKADMMSNVLGEKLSKEIVLLDDYSTNCLEWQLKGGKSIKYLNDINGKTNRFTGSRMTTKDLEKELLAG